MRRKDREIKERSEIVEIIKRGSLCRLAFVDGGEPYVIPMNYGFEMDGDDMVLYFHCAKAGRKIDIIKKNPKVCFETDNMGKAVEVEKGSYKLNFESVIGTGEIEFVRDEAEIIKACHLIIVQCMGEDGECAEKDFVRIEILKLVLKEVSGKRCVAP